MQESVVLLVMLVSRLPIGQGASMRDHAVEKEIALKMTNG
jgi:hypothetical protein